MRSQPVGGTPLGLGNTELLELVEYDDRYDVQEDFRSRFMQIDLDMCRKAGRREGGVNIVMSSRNRKLSNF